MEYNFEIGEYDITQFDGHLNIEYKVKGFWSRGVISIFVRRNYMAKGPDYDFTIMASSGGREKAEVESDAEAYRYYAEALLDAANLIDVIKANHIKDLEKAYQEHVQELARRREEAAAARRAAVENDTKVGRLEAELTVERMKLEAKQRPYIRSRLEYRPRGDDYTREICAVFHERQTTFEHDGRRMSAKDLIDILEFAAEIIDPNKEQKKAA
jgi:hypothetical protein